MGHPRFEFALEQLRAENWRSFERLCSDFLVEEFPALRTTASASGDKGRDGELFVVEGVPRTAFQYSVTVSWKGKISDTLATITMNFPDVRRIIYCTSQEIGAKGDSLRASAWDDQSIQLDIRDKNWFVERAATSTGRATASEELGQAIADPLLQERRIVKVVATPLSREENRIALLQLALNQRDRETERGITKTSFEALVKAALVETSADNTKSLAEVQAAVRSYLPGGNSAQVDALTSSALQRMTKKKGPVKRRSDTEGYHISFEEGENWKEQVAGYILDQAGAETDLAAGAFGLNSALDADYDALREEAKWLRMALESLLLQRGEAFVDAVSGDDDGATNSEMAELIAAMELPLHLNSQQAATAISNLLSAPSERTKNHLLRILDAYTLFAFLQQTPDVQKTLSRVFSGGEIWLDTSAVLPVLGELLVDDPGQRVFTNLLRATKESGLSLFVTDGVIEELQAHLNNSERYIRLAGEWEGRVPFLYTAYMLSGRAESELSHWLEEIRGTEDPRLDIEEFLHYRFGIAKRNLSDLADAADTALRGVVQELWHGAHIKRRNPGRNNNSGSTQRLIEHDVENVVGVIQHRKQMAASPFGYTAWWLTLDSTAYKLRRWLKDQLGEAAPRSPVLSPDYLSQILRLGPLRRVLGVTDVSTLPLTASIRLFEDVPLELIEVARTTRANFAQFDELRIRREVRDALNRSRTPKQDEADYAAILESQIVHAIGTES